MQRQKSRIQASKSSVPERVIGCEKMLEKRLTKSIMAIRSDEQDLFRKHRRENKTKSDQLGKKSDVKSRTTALPQPYCSISSGLRTSPLNASASQTRLLPNFVFRHLRQPLSLISYTNPHHHIFAHSKPSPSVESLLSESSNHIPTNHIYQTQWLNKPPASTPPT